MVDYHKVPYGSLGSLIWITITAVSFMLGLLFYAQYMLPLPDNIGWSEGLALLIRYNINAASSYLENIGQQQRRRQQDPRTRNLPPSFGFLKAGITQSHEIVTLAQGDQYTRSDGPGFIKLYRAERVTNLIDLRPQKRTLPIRANTGDAIPVETSVTVTFRIRQTGLQTNDPNLIYPYASDAIFLVSTYNSIDENGQVQPWTNQIAPQAVALVNQELSKYSLDQLQHPSTPPTALDKIKHEVRQSLVDTAEPRGVEIMSVSISSLIFPDSVTEQRIKTWQAEWQRKIDMHAAASNAQATRRIKEARARAEIEMIERITESIASLRREENANLNEIITLRMIEALEEAMADDSVQALIPQQVMSRLVLDASNQMQEWMNQAPENRQP